MQVSRLRCLRYVVRAQGVGRVGALATDSAISPHKNAWDSPGFYAGSRAGTYTRDQENGSICSNNESGAVPVPVHVIQAEGRKASARVHASVDLAAARLPNVLGWAVLARFVRSPAVMGVAHDAVVIVGHALSNLRAGTDKLLSRKVAAQLPATIRVSSPEFRAGEALPISSTAEGVSVPPVITWDGVPEGTESVLLICEDPDAPFPKPFVHWLVYGIPATARGIPTPHAGVKEGRSSALATGFIGAAPPPGHGLHRYHFQVFALDRTTELGPSLGRGALTDYVRGHVLAWGELVGTYARF